MSDVVNACLNLQGICGLSMTDFWQALKGAAQDDNFFHSNVPVFFPVPNRPACKSSCAFWDVSLHSVPLFSSVEKKPVVSFLLADAAHLLG